MVECGSVSDAIAVARSGGQAFVLLRSEPRDLPRKAKLIERVRPNMQGRIYDRDRQRLAETARTMNVSLPRISGTGAAQHLYVWGWKCLKARELCGASK